jgi:serine/threonine-protein kinase
VLILVQHGPAGPGRCPFCHDQAPAAGKGVECPECGTRVHAECHGLLLRCPTLGCKASARTFRGVRTYLVADRYRVLGRMAPERYGTPIHAHDAKLDRDVVLLYLDGRFGRSADALAADLVANEVRFRRGVPLLDHGRDPRGDRLFLVREFVARGEPLARVVERQAEEPLGVAEALWLAGVVLDSLADLHGRGLSYGELREGESLLLERRETGLHLRLANRGVRPLANASEATQMARPGNLAGSMAYLAPEVLEDAGAAGPPHDLYELGVLLYRLLTTRFPWTVSRGGTLEWLRALGSGTPPTPLRAHRPDLDPQLEAVILRAFAADPAARYPGAAAFAAALQGLG